MKIEEFVQQKNSPEMAISSVVQRLIQIVKNRYGCELEYRSLPELQQNEKELLCCLNATSPALLVKEKAYFPVSVRGQLVGIAEVFPASLFSKNSLNALKDVVGMVIESIHLTANSLEVMNILEDQLLNRKSVSLSPAKESPQNKSSIKKTFNVGFHGNTTFNVPCLIECKSPKDLLKMALEVHNHSRRYAFIHFDQLDTSARTNERELQSLGNISLFIPNITKLNDEEIFTIMNFLKGQKMKNSPQIVAGTLSPIKEVLDNSLIPAELISLLNVAFLPMTQPFTAYREKGLLQFFFTSS